MFDYNEAETWVRLALIAFFLILVFVGVPGTIWKSLGDAGRAVRAELDETVKMRQEAQDLLNKIKQDRIEAEARAKDIIAQAEDEAKRLAEEARIALTENIQRRQRMAEQKIAQAQIQATNEVKSAAADLATRLTQSLMAARAESLTSDPLIDDAIKQIDHRLS